uniref:Uncharacterized protein n=1 Tax=Anguilla anguilla TaxID=7936 RepID=A0A0E9RSC9_ANGAN
MGKFFFFFCTVIDSSLVEPCSDF